MANKNFNNQKINNNGFNFVDFGLPSGTLWATANVGANKPSDYGLYFQWGDVKGYTPDHVGLNKDKKAFVWDDYKLSINGSSSNFSKYKTPGAILDLEDDAAHVNMGGDWHMPTPEQCQELIDNTTSEWTTQDGVNGRLFTSKKDASKTIFIPAAGFAWDGSVHYSGGNGGVWSSMLYTGNVDYGQVLGFFSDNADLYYGSRNHGFSVRGVLG